MPRTLGLDYGDRRLGFAVSDDSGTIAFPHTVVTCRNAEEAVAAIERIAKETRAQKLVVGLPINMNGTLGPRAEMTQEMIRRLRGRLSIPIESWDERLSTCSAEHVLIEAGASRKRRKEVIDKLAAQILLQNYLDAHLVPDTGEGPGRGV